jgi:DNA-binding NarL/FixJ family response regulator
MGKSASATAEAIRSTPPRGTILVVEDQKASWSIVKGPLIARGWTAQRAANGRAALAAVEDTIFAGAMVDLGLPDMHGFDVILGTRGMGRLFPIVVLTGIDDDDDINRAHAIGVSYWRKSSYNPENFDRFSTDCETWLSETPAGLIDRLAEEHGITGRAREVLHEGYFTTDHKLIAAALGISHHTVHSHVQVILEKTGADTFEELMVPIRREVARKARR